MVRGNTRQQGRLIVHPVLLGDFSNRFFLGRLDNVYVISASVCVVHVGPYRLCFRGRHIFFQKGGGVQTQTFACRENRSAEQMKQQRVEPCTSSLDCWADSPQMKCQCCQASGYTLPISGPRSRVSPVLHTAIGVAVGGTSAGRATEFVVATLAREDAARAAAIHSFVLCGMHSKAHNFAAAAAQTTCPAASVGSSGATQWLQHTRL